MARRDGLSLTGVLLHLVALDVKELADGSDYHIFSDHLWLGSADEVGDDVLGKVEADICVGHCGVGQK